MSWWIYFFNYSRKTHVNSLNLWFYSTVKVVKRFWFLFRATVKNKFASFYISRILITLLSSRARIAADILFLSCYFITEHFGRKFSSFFLSRANGFCDELSIVQVLSCVYSPAFLTRIANDKKRIYTREKFHFYCCRDDAEASKARIVPARRFYQ